MTPSQTSQSETSTALATRSSSDLAQISELEKILLTNEAPAVVDEDPEEISRQIVARLLGAETDQELEMVGEATGWRDLLGVPVLIKGFRWAPSDYEEGSAVFFVVNGLIPDEVTGELSKPVVLTTGSRNVLAQLCNLAKRGRLPGAVRMMAEAGKQTARGFKPLFLVTPPGYTQADEAAVEDTVLEGTVEADQAEGK